MSSSPTTLPPYRSVSFPSPGKRPITVASTSSARNTARHSSSFAGGTEITIRSCASLIQISVYERPSS